MRTVVYFMAGMVAMMLAAPSMLLAVEVPAVSPLEFAVSAEAHWIWTILASEAVAGVAGWLFLRIYERIQGTRYGKAVQAIKDAITACYHEYVRAIKIARADGKLTVEEKNHALNLALQLAIDIAKSQAVDLLIIYAK